MGVQGPTLSLHQISLGTPQRHGLIFVKFDKAATLCGMDICESPRLDVRFAGLSPADTRAGKFPSHSDCVSYSVEQREETHSLLNPGHQPRIRAVDVGDERHRTRAWSARCR
jgi:hypothetical protein